MAGNEPKQKLKITVKSPVMVNANASSATGTKSIARSFVAATPVSPKLQIGATTR